MFCSLPRNFRCCNAFSCACKRVRVFVCVYPAQYALITCECHVPSITFPYVHQHWHKGNALYYMVRDIREATVAPLRRMKAANQRYCSRHLGEVLASQIHSASGIFRFLSSSASSGRYIRSSMPYCLDSFVQAATTTRAKKTNRTSRLPRKSPLAGKIEYK